MSDTIQDVFKNDSVTPWVFKEEGDKTGPMPDLLMGVELEIEGCEYQQDTYARNLNKLGWRVETDNSLRGGNLGHGFGPGGNAFEFVTRPMKKRHLLHSLEKFFEYTKFTKDNYSDRTSVHVHVNCLDLTLDQVSTLCLLYSVVEDVLFEFIGNNRENNIFCIPWTQCRYNAGLVDRMLRNNVESLGRNWAKYTALNLVPLTNYGTVEFRHMEGTCDIKRITQWLNMIAGLINVVNYRTLEETKNLIKTLNSTSEYEGFFHSIFGEYLPYDNRYREKLEAGVILAKYGMIPKEKKKTAQLGALGDMEGHIVGAVQYNWAGGNPPRVAAALEEQQVAIPPPPVEPLLRNRLNPWPPVGAVVHGPFSVAEGDRIRQQLPRRSIVYRGLDSYRVVGPFQGTDRIYIPPNEQLAIEEEGEF